MKSLKLPLTIESEGIAVENDIKRSIDASLNLLISTSLRECASDIDFGFVFNNLRFEIFNETDGVVYDSNGTDREFDVVGGNMYDKKISGNSRNVNTFAADLKESVVKYETRLSKVKVSMSYVRLERTVYITINGVINGTEEDYVYSTKITTWK